MRVIPHLCAVLLLLPMLLSCGGQMLTDHAFFAMDTVITLRLPDGTDPSVLRGCEQLVYDTEQIFSATLADSEVGRINASAGDISLSPEVLEVLRTALATAEATDGAFDPTVAPLTALWNITAAEPVIPADADIRALLPVIGFRHLNLSGDVLSKDASAVSLDLGGCAKGYACQRAVEYLRESGLETGLVSFGGNIGIVGPKASGEPWKIGIRHPDIPGELAGYLFSPDGFVSVSGDYERYFIKDGVRYHHILDASTGYPADSGIRSAAVLCDDGTLADALSTALFVLGEAGTMALYESGQFSFEAVLYTTDKRTVITPGLVGRYESCAPDITPPKN